MHTPIAIEYTTSTVVQAFDSGENLLLDPICIESKFLAICNTPRQNEGPMKSYASNRPGTNLACFLAVFGMVLTGGGAIAQLVIDYPRDVELLS